MSGGKVGVLVQPRDVEEKKTAFVLGNYLMSRPWLGRVTEVSVHVDDGVRRRRTLHVHRGKA
jgi:hypothetical protein